MAAESEREELELELAGLRARVRDEERECAEQAQRARELKEEVVRLCSWFASPRFVLCFQRRSSWSYSLCLLGPWITQGGTTGLSPGTHATLKHD